MAETLIARSQRQQGIAVLDTESMVHFAVGIGAGVAGVDPKMALLAALMAEGVIEVIKAQSTKALFEPGHGQSKINEIFDLLTLTFGAYLGKAIRLHSEAQTAAVATEPPAQTSGLGNPGKLIGITWDPVTKRYVFLEAAA
jgi:hypothetical protein